MELIELKIYGISYSDNTSGAFALILTEINGSKKLPIVIGGFEAQAIAVALEKKIKTSRPLTHELFKGFADKFNIKINHVIIHKLIEGIFFSNLVCEKDDKIIKIDSRTSFSSSRLPSLICKTSSLFVLRRFFFKSISCSNI